ncbi:uncharacterized protein LAESUDRAFT_758738 [Laetiporus sulphureus 93-53]|uniref:BTB domain-containing protein n=1 Tax=Laetiporus sulphureus 93-53 TaxID=1314785 RepID=A0A165ELT3_9APHY|nr:uncharacterized protein LAESUDRAFT_758738 [Laetiporus sulphureus 93-53]KZT07324.1 hypothetical protein LAESUDRAFT_758738 [Laetiporus sulphureus 93-53]
MSRNPLFPTVSQETSAESPAQSAPSSSGPCPRSPHLTDAPAPFNKSTADVVLRSKDMMDFHVRKAILIEASAFFEDMFRLPQVTEGESAGSGWSDKKYNLPIIPMEEDNETLDRLLRLCYPISPPDLDDVNQLSSVLKAARKYLMDDVVQMVCIQMRKLAKTVPLRVYALALQFGLEEEARFAAKCSLAIPLRDKYVPELEDITGGAYYRILDYHEKCSAAAACLSSDYSWVRNLNPKYIWFGRTSHGVDCALEWDGIGNIRAWWKNSLPMLKAVTDSTPSGEAITYSQPAVVNALIAASACNTCKNKGPWDMLGFISHYAAEVDKATSQVELEIKF